MTDTDTHTLTPGEAAQVARWQEGEARREAERERLEAIRPGLGEYAVGEHADEAARKPRDVAAAMRGERALPDMLWPGWLVRGVLHWVYSDAEAGKTWLALKWAVGVMRNGGVVLWSDEELGVNVIADRLLALGATPEAIEHRFIYLVFSDWTTDDEDVQSWRELLKIATPDLVVFDTATDHLVSADLDEDKGVDVTAWVKRYPEAATSLGLTTVVLDHTGKANAGQPGRHAVGSRAKRAKAKVQYALTTPRGGGYDRDRMGKVKVELTKNTLGAILLDGDRERMFDVGGDGAGNFTWTRATGAGFPAHPGDDHGATAFDRHKRIVKLLMDEGGPMNASQIRGLVTGANTAIAEVLAQLAEGDTWPVRGSTSGRSTVYEYVDPNLEKLQPARTTTPKRKPAAKPRPRRATATKSNPKPKPKVKLRTAVSPSKGKKK